MKPAININFVNKFQDTRKIKLTNNLILSILKSIPHARYVKI